jgi:hypothetical protein
LFLCAGATTAEAQVPREGPPAAFTRAIQCRTITDPQQRLACYDREVTALEVAERRSDIRVVDRQQVRRTRRSLFGLTLPDLNIFGGDNDETAVREITGTISGVSTDAYGKHTFTLEDGARWRQLDSRQLNIDPRPGQPIRIRRGAIGSFLANVNNQIAIRVQRVQ